MVYLESLILSFMDAILVIIIGRKLMKRKPIVDVWGILIVILLSFTLSLASEFIPEEYNIYIDSLITFVVFIVYFKIKIYESAMLTIIFSIVVILLQVFSFLPVIFIFGEVKVIFTHGLIAQLTSLTIAILLYYFIPINVIYEFTQKKNRTIKIIAVNIFVLLFIVLTYWYLKFDGFLENAFLIVGTALSLVVLNGVIIRNGLRNNHEKKQLELYKAYMPIIDRLSTEIRKKQHDFNNHLQTIQTVVMTSGSLQEIREEVASYNKQIMKHQNDNELIAIDNKILAGFIQSKKQQVCEEKKQINISIQKSIDISPIENYDMIEMLGILLDNAIEATRKHGLIELFMLEEGNNLRIVLKNQSPYITQDKMKEFFIEGFSSKGENRGLGLSKLKTLIDKHKGEILIENEDNEKQQNFVVFHVVIPKI